MSPRGSGNSSSRTTVGSSFNRLTELGARPGVESSDERPHLRLRASISSIRVFTTFLTRLSGSCLSVVKRIVAPLPEMS